MTGTATTSGAAAVDRGDAADPGDRADDAPAGGSRARPSRLAPLLAVGGVVVVALAVVSLCVGDQLVAPDGALGALLGGGDAATTLLVRDSRAPRTLIGICVGAALGVAGAASQALTRNPLASPSVLGLVHGAAFAVVIAIALFSPDPQVVAAVAVAGAALSTLVVFVVATGRGGRPDTARLVLGGMAVSGLCLAGIEVFLVRDELAFDQSRRWLIGSFADRPMAEVLPIVPLVLVGVVVCLALAPTLDLLESDEDVASALGQRVVAARVAAGVAICLLTGAAVALGGPIVFVGLAVPHLARRLVGAEHRRVVPLSLVCGAVLVLVADIAVRVLPLGGARELPVGVVTALVGGPVFVLLARRLRVARS